MNTQARTPMQADDYRASMQQAASRFIETKPENYAGIEEAARAAGLLK